MRVAFHGTRGSLPAPGPDTVKYGGNTTCLSIDLGQAGGGRRIILDGGSGIRPLGLELMRSMPLTCDIFITHTHWDHIHGLPFFVPLFVPGNTITIHGPPDPVAMQGVESVLASQMAYPHFPVRSAELKADIRYETLSEGQTVQVGPATVETLLMNHPALCLGYKVTCGGKSVFFTGDHEPVGNIYGPDEPEYADYERVVRERAEAMDSFLQGVDLLIADSQYTDQEYRDKKGWGHATFSQCMDLARRVGARTLVFTHHETTRTDDELDAIMAGLTKANPDLNLLAAAEGLVLDLPASG